ncbi:hypothetical protein B0H16DRAFT_1600810 [Mycena metata]|uniref:DUF6534 domain-containing protein n=1 Tax=Mycena metata TaxID=1033252 RepID=A0AAD7ML17_9AGAR|nr:hypothetical protein B0H16DRAFT_1600810 [Mycena metata]
MAAPPGLVPLPPNIGTITSSQLIGTLLNFFLFGTLFIQVFVYNACFPKDRAAIKWLVYFVFFTMAVCTCLNAADVHYWFGSGFGDLVKFGQARFSPFYTPIMGSIIALVVQLFFCYRISVFRASAVWWSVLIASISFLQAAGGMGGGIKAFIASNEQHDQVRTTLVYLWLVGDAVADVAIAATMTYLLTQASERQTQDIVRGVVRLIVETNIFSASVATIGLVLFAAMPEADYFICPTMILPGIYANTFLVLLNNRAAPSRGRDDVVHIDGAYPSGGSETTFTANGTNSDPWKSSGLTTPTPHARKFDAPAPTGRRKYTPDAIPIGDFVAAPNVHLEDFSATSPTVGRPSAAGNHIVSEWDDASYKDSSFKDSSFKNGMPWDEPDEVSMNLGDVEHHPYGTAGAYISFAR